MTFEAIRQRSDVLGTPTIAGDTGKKLGFVSQLWVDIDQQAVIGLSLRSALMYGDSQFLRLSSIQQIEEVILVDNDAVIEAIDVASYNHLINCEVVTETGNLLGKVRDFKFDLSNGNVTGLILASIGLSFLPTHIVSTYELPATEIISSGCDRLIASEGSEERLLQLSVGVLERLGVGSPPWERDEEDDYSSCSQGTFIQGTFYNWDGIRADNWNDSEDDWDDPAGGTAPSPRPRNPAPKPIIDDAAATPDL